jgi:hypothetical protein
VAGSSQIFLRDDQLAWMHAEGVRRVDLRAAFCLDPSGAISCIDFGGNDQPRDVVQWIIDHMLEWKFEPYVVAGQGQPFCGAASFHYKIQ